MRDNDSRLGVFALLYKSLGWWPVLRSSGDTKAHGARRDICVVLGQPSGSLVDIEFSWDEAQELALELLDSLPGYGPGSDPLRHRLARGNLRNDHLRFEIPSSAAHLFSDRPSVVLELRGDGHEAAVPPCLDAEGESLAWWGFPNNPPCWKEGELEDTGGTTAALAVVAHAYGRSSGNRDTICEALTGALVLAGLHPSDVDLFVEKVAFLAKDEDWFKRGTGAAAIRARIDAGEYVMNIAELCRELGIKPMANTLRQWFGIQDGNSEDGGNAAPGREPNVGGDDHE